MRHQHPGIDGENEASVTAPAHDVGQRLTVLPPLGIRRYLLCRRLRYGFGTMVRYLGPVESEDGGHDLLSIGSRVIAARRGDTGCGVIYSIRDSAAVHRIGYDEPDRVAAVPLTAVTQRSDMLFSLPTPRFYMLDDGPADVSVAPGRGCGNYRFAGRSGCRTV